MLHIHSIRHITCGGVWVKRGRFAIGRVPVGRPVGFLGLILDVAVLGEEIENLFRIKAEMAVVMT